MQLSVTWQHLVVRTDATYGFVGLQPTHGNLAGACITLAGS